MAIPAPSSSSTALVTGASSGIGTELARGLARRGHGVTLVARRRARLQELARALADEHGVRAQAIACDLGDATARDGLAEEIAELGLAVEVVVNNAGYGTYVAFHESPRGREVGMVHLNVEAVVDLTARYLPAMVERGRGALLSTASSAAYQPLPHNATYAASKAFVLSHGLALHEEVAPRGVTVTVLCPGPVHTEFQASAEMDDPEALLPKPLWQPVGKVAEEALEGLEKGRRVVVPGTPNAVLAALSRATPYAVLMPVLGAATRRGLS